ncbi:MAG: FtsX-like permease family protein [Acidobacteria bacterium]|nr:FtsX-like permease family protein [Acidobacteriota bacterium]
MLKVTLRGLLAHKVRLIATAVAVVLGVAFMAGTQVLTSSISASFDKVFSDVYASIDVVVRSTNEIETPFGSQRTRISDSVLPAVEAVPGVDAAEGQVVGQIRVLGRDNKPLVRTQGPPNFALNWLTEPALNGWTIVEGAPPAGPDQIVLDVKTSKDGDFAIGDTVSVAVSTGVNTYRLVGIARFGRLDTWGGAPAALFDTTTAQALVGEPGTYNWVSIAGDDGISQTELTDRVAAAIPADTEAITGKDFTAESQDAFQKIIGIFNTFLLVFALIALFVGSFIIYNTFSIIVAQRTRELALLRALGASRRQVLGSVMLEAFTVGVIASAVGVGLGVLLAIGLNALMQSIGFSGPDTPIVVPASAVISSVLVGTLITLASAVLPARRAATIAPMAAMRDVATESRGLSRRRIIGGAVLLVGGAASLWFGLFGNSDSGLQLVGLGAFLVFMGFTVIGPVIAPPMARALGAPLARFGGVSGRIARENAMRNPRRTATTASALMIGVGLVGFIAVTAQSLKVSTVEAINTSVTAQYVVNTDGFGSTALPISLVGQITALPEVSTAAGISATFANIEGDARVIIATQPAAFEKVVAITDVEGSFAGLDTNGIAIPKTMAKDKKLAVGDSLAVNFLHGGPSSLVIESIYDTKFPIQGPGYFISDELFAQVTPPDQQTVQSIYIDLTDTSAAGVAEARVPLDAVTSAVPGAELQSLKEFTKAQTDQANQFLVIVYVLLALALVIAIVGVINTLLLSVYERTRELGLLRAVGMSRRQVRSSIRTESVIISLIGTLIGLGIGLVFGWALVKALYDQGITSFAVPWVQLIVIVALAALAGIGAALYPAWRASRLDVLQAISSE